MKSPHRFAGKIQHMATLRCFKGSRRRQATLRGMPSETNIMQVVEDVVPVEVDPSHLSSPNWKDESGVEAWLLPPTIPADAPLESD
jgi:hypothetical protein